MADEVFRRDENRVTTSGGLSETAGEIVQFKFDDTTERALVDSTSEEQGHGAVGDGYLTLATADTSARVITASTACKRVWIQAHKNNTGLVAVGGTHVNSGTTEMRGKYLYATQGDWVKVSNVNLLYAMASAVNSTLIFFYEN